MVKKIKIIKNKNDKFKSHLFFTDAGYPPWVFASVPFAPGKFLACMSNVSLGPFIQPTE